MKADSVPSSRYGGMLAMCPERGNCRVSGRGRGGSWTAARLGCCTASRFAICRLRRPQRPSARKHLALALVLMQGAQKKRLAGTRLMSAERGSIALGASGSGLPVPGAARRRKRQRGTGQNHHRRANCNTGPRADCAATASDPANQTAPRQWHGRIQPGGNPHARRVEAQAQVGACQRRRRAHDPPQRQLRHPAIVL